MNIFTRKPQSEKKHPVRFSRMGRRMFFKSSAAALGGYLFFPSERTGTVAKAGVSTLSTAQNVIFIQMQGAVSHTDTFDLKEGAWTPSFMAPTSYGKIRFPQGLMPNLANSIQDIALLRSLRSHNTAHQLAQTWFMIGRNPVQGLNRIAPHIGSVVAMELGSKNATLPYFISLNAGSGPGAGFLPATDEPFYLSPTGGGLPNTSHPDGAAALDRRLELAFELDTEQVYSQPLGAGPDVLAEFRVKARELMYNGAVSNVFTFDQNTRNAYGNSGFGNACITARNLIRSGLGTRFIQITHGSWDHHTNIYAPNNNLQLMARQFDSGLGQLIADLKSDGSFASTLIVAAGEFGRTVGPLTSNNGRDHHVQQSALFAGGGVRGGQVIGSTSALGDSVDDPGWSAGRNAWAEDIEATIYSALGIDYSKVIHADNLGRGFYYVPDQDPYTYQPINELFG
jgi:Protein of unknown function (DUF1501)